MTRLTKVELSARTRLIVEHGIDDGRGVTSITIEICEAVDEWRAIKAISIGNAGLFLLHDAIGRACEMAMREPR